MYMYDCSAQSDSVFSLLLLNVNNGLSGSNNRDSADFCSR